MPAKVLKSTANVTFIQSKLIQDVQIVIDNRDLYNSLPGKLERHGIKTLTTWPVFVTAVLNEEADDQCEYAIERHQAEMQVRDSASEASQLQIFDMTRLINPLEPRPVVIKWRKLWPKSASCMKN